MSWVRRQHGSVSPVYASSPTLIGNGGIRFGLVLHLGDSSPRVSYLGSSWVGVCGEGPVWMFHRGEGAQRDPSNVRVSEGFIPTKWVVDRTLSLTSDNTLGIVGSYGRPLLVRAEWSVAPHPGGLAQRCDAPSLINARLSGLSYRVSQVIAFATLAPAAPTGLLVESQFHHGLLTWCGC
ncbi:hypothetical protein GW17_00010450 [Ensete ventricosum]|nr:hypothetical protein GW17_00010450 [Ensete ventricosum]